MGHHAIIGDPSKHKLAPRVRVTDRRYTSQPLTTGTDVNLPGDKRGYMGASLPMTAVYNLKADAVGQEFKSKLAKSIVTVGDWHQNDRGTWIMATQKHGLIRVTKGAVLVNRDLVGYVPMTGMVTKAGRENVITGIIAGTLPQAKVESVKSEASERTAKAYTGGDVTAFTVYAVRAGKRIKYTVPEGKTCGEIVDDMHSKGYEIVKITN